MICAFRRACGKPWLRRPRIAIICTAAARAVYLTRAYADLVEDADRLTTVLKPVASPHAAEQVDHWLSLAAAGAFTALADGLMEHHYDGRYAKHRARMEVPVADVVADRLNEGDLPALADRVAEAAAALRAKA